MAGNVYLSAFFLSGKTYQQVPLVTSESLSLAKAAGIFTQQRSIPGMLDYFEKLCSGDAFRGACILNVLIFNSDRHYGNFGALFDRETMEPISMCPVFDRNRSLFLDLDQDQLEHPDWLSGVHGQRGSSQLSCVPATGTAGL